jgi:hypothetical protein
MRITDFPNCCTAKIVYDFGETAVSGMYKGARTKKEVRKYLKEELLWSRGVACVVVITNSSQKNTNAVLRELGFCHSPWMEKKPHSNTKIRLWWKPPTENKKKG